MRDGQRIVGQRRRPRRRSRAVALTALLAVAGWAWASPVAATVPPIPGGGEPVDEGSVVVTDPNGLAISGGASATLYSLDLPDGASCPGDSASQNWYVQGFLIPAADDPGAIEYGVIGPEGSQFPLFAFDTKPYAHQLTQVSSVVGGPGVIPAVPPLTFGVFEPGYIPPGAYRIGIACTFYRQTARYWDTEIVIEADPADTPAGLRFTVTDAPDGAPRLGGGRGWSTWFVLAGALGAAALLVAVVGARRSRRHAPTPTSAHDTPQSEVSP